jgi:hypothetical protein
MCKYWFKTLGVPPLWAHGSPADRCGCMVRHVAPAAVMAARTGRSCTPDRGSSRLSPAARHVWSAPELSARRRPADEKRPSATNTSHYAHGCTRGLQASETATTGQPGLGTRPPASAVASRRGLSTARAPRTRRRAARRRRVSSVRHRHELQTLVLKLSQHIDRGPAAYVLYVRFDHQTV